MLSVRRRQEDAGGAAGMGDDAELEEGEAWGDDTAFVDPDVALSYIDEKLQDVLGHFQKDFEGGVSAENLGSKFGGYGSFLPTYQRSPPLPQTISPPKAANLSSRSPYHQSTKGVSQNSPSVAVPSVSQNPSSSNAEPPTSPSPTVRAPEPPPPPSPSPTIRAPEPLTP